MLTVLEELPRGLLDLEARDLHRVLGGPTLFHLPGAAGRALFVSVLLHGNEVTGWEALRSLLAGRPPGRPLPRPLSLLVGNVAAARAGRRHLDGQPDYNRVWRGSGTAEHEMAARVLAEMRARGVFACIDVHNTSGRNPRYGCVVRLDGPSLGLARLFGRLTVHFTRPREVIVDAFSDLCPSLTVECGLPGEPTGVAAARTLVERVLALEAVPRLDPDRAETDLDLYHTVATVRVRDGLSVGHRGEGTDVEIDADIDRLNFTLAPPGTVLARVRPDAGDALEVLDDAGAEVADLYLARADGAVATSVPVTPAMLTPDTRIVVQDCLGHLMERLEG